ncbi:MAG: GGDEF domain-containing protein, partial [Lachnospiraceae bacterium]|nr:GGDEF domain-containing protein [Lachnospiraceae bacterium]
PPIFHIFLTIHLTFKHKKLKKNKQSDAILCFILIIIAAVFIQYMYPAYLVTGVAITLAILMIFFTMQNPEDMLDLISGMFNYNAMMSFLRTYLAEKHDLCLIAIDVGGIRRINSAFGVEMGNLLLAKIGTFFNSFNGDVWAFRMIGTKFLITTSNEQEYNDIIIRVEERFNGPWHLNGMDVSLSATIRYFGEPDFFNTPEDIINLIDLAYSQIESDGWGTKKCINTYLLHQANRKLTIENAIRESLRSEKGFVLHYQPIFDIEKHKFLSAEVLLRLEHPDLGSIPPSEFIPIAEKTGLILQIDELVIRKACDFLSRNNSRNQLGIKYLEINLSAAEFFQNSASDIHGIIRKSGISPSLLCFEVTETAATVHQEILSDFMDDMINLGYSFALDDFGMGYANISQVLNLPFSIVKLDRTLLISDEEKNMLIFDIMLDMFSKMGLTTIVEGVETLSQSERVSRLGGKHIQGYFFAHPMPEREFVKFLQEKIKVYSE